MYSIQNAAGKTYSLSRFFIFCNNIRYYAPARFNVV